MSTLTPTTPAAPATAPPASPKPRRHRRGAAAWTTVVVIAAGAVVTAAPFLLLLLNAFKSSADYSTHGPLAWPTSFTFDAFADYLSRVDFPLALANSVVVSVVVSFAGVAIGLLAAYAIGVGRIRGRTSVVAVLLLATMLPHEALIYPLFYGAQATGTLNTIWSVIIVFTVLQGAYATYLLSSVMSTVPPSLLEAAALDGASRWRILTQVVAPVLRPTMGVLVVFFFIWTWNEFYIPLVLLADPASQTVPIALSTLRGQHSIDITVLNAGSLLSLLPTLAFFVFFQRTLSRGVTAGAVK